MLIWILLTVWLSANVLLVASYRRDLTRVWVEPVLRHPVLVVDSDDWGAGPTTQAVALRQLAAVLQRHRDTSGRPPVFSLALILALAEPRAMADQGVYRRIGLDDPVHADILAALREGERAGVFTLQLHGMEHFWPATLLACHQQEARAWLREPDGPVTEMLPSHLQSRWVDSGQLPSKPHDAASIHAAVVDEVAAYQRMLGAPPRVVVPPTFVWTQTVEAAWSEQGIEFIVTPGWRYTCRNAAGQPDGREGPMHNGEAGPGVTYLTRFDYFEPSRGRDAAHALRALDKATAQGRPCLLENHRDNFLADVAACERALREVDMLYQRALIRYPELRFMSTEELGQIMRARNPAWVETRALSRLPSVIQRARALGRFWKLANLSGLAWLLNLAGWYCRKACERQASAS